MAFIGKPRIVESMQGVALKHFHLRLVLLEIGEIRGLQGKQLEREADSAFRDLVGKLSRAQGLVCTIRFLDAPIQVREVGYRQYWLRTTSEIEQRIARVYVMKRVRAQVSAVFPLEVLQGGRFWLDFEPFMLALKQLNLGPIRYVDVPMNGLAVARYVIDHITPIAGQQRPLTPKINFDCSSRNPSLHLFMTTNGCQFVKKTRGKSEVVCLRRQSSITGPLIKTTEGYANPELVFTVTRLSPDRAASMEALMRTLGQKELQLRLARDIAAAVLR